MTSDDRPAWWRRVDPLVPFWLVLPFLVWGPRGFLDGLGRDSGLYLYAGQAVADGEPPYVAVFNRAGPLAHWLPGLGVGLGRLFGTTDLMGVRVLFFVIAALTPLIIYLTARTTYRSRLAACAAAASMLAFELLALMSTDGPESKLPMVMLLALSVLLAVQRRMFVAGIATGLATLTWQPVFLGAAAAALVMILTTTGGWRARGWAAGRYAVGGLLTLAVTAGYFVAAGAWQAFLDGFWIANSCCTDQPGLLDKPQAVRTLLFDWYFKSSLMLVTGTLLTFGLAGWALWRRGSGWMNAEMRNRQVALAAALAAVGLWTLQAFNRAPDTLPLLPLAAVGIGGGVAVLRQVAARADWSRKGLVALVAVWVAVAVVTTLQLTVSNRDPKLTKTQALSERMFAPLPPDAAVMSAGAPQPLALTGRRSISKYQLFDPGIRKWIDRDWPGGVNAYVAWLIDEAPPVLLIGRRGLDPMLHPFRDHYVRVGEGHGWKVWLHEDLPPETRDAVAAKLTRRKRANANQ